MAKFPSQHDKEKRKGPRFPCEMRVDMICDGQELRCVSFDIGADGVFVRTNTPPQPARIVRVVAHPPNEETPIEWMGRVTRLVSEKAATSSQPQGVALEIFGIGAKERIRWTDLLADCAYACEERSGPLQVRRTGESPVARPRQHVRVHTPIEVSIRDMRGLFRFVARDISAGGVFVRCSEPHNVDGTVELQVRHPVSGQVFVLHGRVARLEPGGMAVQFTDLDAQHRRALQRFIMTGRASS